jgi:excisionase family DNA binding protein
VTLGRLLTLQDVAEELATSQVQVYALVRRGDLRAGRMGGRNQWRVSRGDLEAYIAQAYENTAKWVEEHPFEAGRGPS